MSDKLMPDWGSKENLKKVRNDWLGFAKEDISVEYLGRAYYAFGSELACLRLFKAYYRGGDKAKAGYSDNQKSWFFRLEVC